jgi:lysophospholipase L1-like esterase
MQKSKILAWNIIHKSVKPLLVVFILQVVLSCNTDSTKAIGNGELENTGDTNSKEYTYLALGDSYTIGESVDKSLRFPVQLADTLNKSGIDVSEATIVAKTGWTTSDLAEGIKKRDLNNTYDLVTLLIGVNNQYQGLSIEEYRDEFEDLLNQSINFAGGDAGKVIVISIPDYSVTPFAESSDREEIAREIDAFNQVNKELAEQAGTKYVNVTPISRQAEENPDLIAEDGLHPSGLMYSMWVEIIYAKAREAITQ